MKRLSLTFAFLVLCSHVWAQTSYYVDPNVTGRSNNGSITDPWTGISQINYTTVNTALASGPVTIYFSATPASHAANTVDTSPLNFTRTDASTNLLTFDGASLYNNNDTLPSSGTWVANTTLTPAGCVAATQFRCAATQSWSTGFHYQIGTSTSGVTLPFQSNATYTNCIGNITIQGFHAYRGEGQTATLNYIHDLTFQYNEAQGIPSVAGTYGPGVYVGPGNNGPCLIAAALASGTANTSGTAVSWVSGTQFTTGAAWVGGKTITINGTKYGIASVTSATALTLTATAGTQTGVSFSVPQFSGPDNVTVQYNYIHDTFEDLFYAGASTPDPPGFGGSEYTNLAPDSHGLTCGTACPTGANYLIQFNTMENSATPGGGENQCFDIKDGHSNLIIQNNTCQPTLAYSGTPPPGGPGINMESGGTVRGNFINGPATQGVGMHTSWNNTVGRSDSQLYNNMIVNAHWSTVGDNSGLRVWNDSTGQLYGTVEMQNNTLYSDNVAFGGACITVDSGSTTGGVTVTNDIIDTCGGGSISGTTTHDYNDCFNAGATCPTETHGITTNPSFVSTTAPYIPTNFELQSGSPAIGAGVNLSSIFTTDYFGNVRTSPWNMGFWQAGVSTAPTVTSIAATQQNGQTFITWTDAATGATGGNYRYNLYRATGGNCPITSTSGTGVTQIEYQLFNNSGQVVAPLSYQTGVGYSNTYNQAMRQDTSVTYPMDALTNLGTPLANWTGVGVYTNLGSATSCYAVITHDTTGATADSPISAGANSMTGTVSESLATPQPIKQLDSTNSIRTPTAECIPNGSTCTTGTPTGNTISKSCSAASTYPGIP